MPASSPTKRWLLRFGSFALAAALLFLALRDADLGAMAEALRRADYRWLAPLLALTVLGHWLRAWRWRLLMRSLPGHPDVPTTAAFGALMIGYMVNYAAPRLGELARTGNLAYRYRLPFGGVLGTVVVDRTLDMVMLGLGLATSAWILLDRSEQLRALLIDPVAGAAEGISGPLLVLIAGAVLLVTVGGILLVWRLRRSRHPLVLRVAPLIAAFWDGLLSVIRSDRPFALVASTVGIWVAYALMTYVPLRMLGMAQAYDLDLLDAWAITFIGAIGFAIPSPGGAGTYHFFTIESMRRLFGVAATPAQTFAVLAHAAQMAFSLVAGALALLLQGTSLREAQAAAEASDLTAEQSSA